MYLIAKAKVRQHPTCCQADGQTLLTLLKEEVTVATASMVAPVNTCVRVESETPSLDLPSLAKIFLDKNGYA